MTSQIIELKEVSIVTEIKAATRLEFDVVRVTLTTATSIGNASIHFRLYGPAGDVVRVGAVEMQGDAYAAWSADDAYVTTWLLGVLGAMRA
jgi:hypothetical protein